MAEYTIDKIEYDGNVYKLQDNVSGYITSDSDKKVTVAALTSGTTYYPILATGNGTATRQIDSTIGGLKYVSTAGTTSAVGTARLQLGNGTASGTTTNEQGVIRLYGTTAYYTDIKAESGLPAANRTIYVPSYAGTMYLTCTSTTNAVGGAETAPVYVDNTGCIQAVTSIPYSLLTGTPTIPTDTNTWRKVQLDGTDKLGTAISTNPLNLKAGTNVSITESSGTFTFSSTDTNTTYSLSGALSSHKFTSTLTAGGSGSGTSTSDFTLAAGTGITITDDTSNRKMTIACSVTNTDENVKSTAGGAGTDAFYLTGSSSSSTATGTLVKHAEIYAGHNPSGAYISIGGSSSNYRGWIKLYSSGASYYATLQPADNFTDNRIITLPNKTGTIALTSDIPTIPITDVQAFNNNTESWSSVVSSKVAKIPLATNDIFGGVSISTLEGTLDISYGDGEGLYTVASAPLIDSTTGTIDVTSLPLSGVTAGTYTGGFSSKVFGIYLPSFTIDNTGRVTSATNLSTFIPELTNSNANYYANMIGGYTWSLALREMTTTHYTLSAGDTSTTKTISSDGGGYYSYKQWVRVIDVKAWDYNTYEPVIVDWVTSGWNSRGSGTSITLTVSIKEAYEHSIAYLPILSYGTASM